MEFDHIGNSESMQTIVARCVTAEIGLTPLDDLFGG